VHHLHQLLFRGRAKGISVSISELKPIQMPGMDMGEFYDGRKAFTEEQWLDVLIVRAGMDRRPWRTEPSGTFWCG
jgi:ATP-dependent Lon protease